MFDTENLVLKRSHRVPCGSTKHVFKFFWARFAARGGTGVIPADIFKFRNNRENPQQLLLKLILFIILGPFQKSILTSLKLLAIKRTCY